MARVLLFGAGWIACLTVLVLAFGLPTRPEVASPARREPEPLRRPTADEAPSPPPPPPRVGIRYPGWTVTRAYSAHHMMVVEVETDNVTTGVRIAAQIVEPLKGRYDEVLVYVRAPGQRPDDLPARRIQWTPRGGYIESIYAR
ncbi:MAG: hypothetical protein ACRD26_09250 [Vicinamibacterales bacterium]